MKMGLQSTKCNPKLISFTIKFSVSQSTLTYTTNTCLQAIALLNLLAVIFKERAELVEKKYIYIS